MPARPRDECSRSSWSASDEDRLPEGVAINCTPRCLLREADHPAASITALDTALSEFSGIDVDDLATYDPQTTFRPDPQAGVTAFRDLVLSTFPGTHSLGVNRLAGVPGRSEHKEGRAWDWGVCRDCQGGAAEALLRWLLAPDDLGNPFAAARRFGIMYVIWDSRIWGSYAADEGWRPYGGPNPHTDHVHFSFSWCGALGLTSWWTTAPVRRTALNRL